jgi:hypothetical protein
VNRRSGKPRVQWTDEMISALRELRRRGENLTVCAKRIGVAHIVARAKARELGIAQHMGRGSISGVKACGGAP